VAGKIDVAFVWGPIAGYFAKVAADPAVRVGAEPLPYRVVDGKVDQATYVGWWLFQTNCATCHGNDATGSDRGPNLLPLIKEMPAKRFVGTVLMRYKLVVPPGSPPGSSAPARR
jgi:mono/diheme cytochrome c family protein